MKIPAGGANRGARRRFDEVRSGGAGRARGLDEVDLLIAELDPAGERPDQYRERVELL